MSVIKVFSGNSIFIQRCQSSIMLLVVPPRTMLVLCINETATNTLLHINQVEFNNAGDVAPVLLVQVVAPTLFSRQFQIDT